MDAGAIKPEAAARTARWRHSKARTVAAALALSQTIVQLLVPAHMRGRVMAVWMINWGLMPLGLLPLSATAERLGTPVAMVIGGSLSLCVGVFVAAWGRQLWTLTAAGMHAAEEQSSGATDGAAAKAAPGD